MEKDLGRKNMEITRYKKSIEGLVKSLRQKDEEVDLCYSLQVLLNVALVVGRCTVWEKVPGVIFQAIFFLSAVIWSG